MLVLKCSLMHGYENVLEPPLPGDRSSSCTVRNLWHCFWQRSSWGWQVGGDLRHNPYPCPKPINSERVTPPVTLLCRRNQINHNGTQLDWRHAELRVKIFPKFTHFSDYFVGGRKGLDGVCWGTRNDCHDTQEFLTKVSWTQSQMHCSWLRTNKPHQSLCLPWKNWQLLNWSRNTLLDCYEIRTLVVVLTGQHPKPADSFVSSRCIHFPQHLSWTPFFFSGQVLHLHETTCKIAV